MKNHAQVRNAARAPCWLSRQKMVPFTYSILPNGEIGIVVWAPPTALYIRADHSIEPQRAMFPAHANAIFDLKWHPNDEYIATASGDQTVAISSVHNENRVTTLVEHTQSVKCLAWDPENGNVLCSGGRDGTINIWDLRVGERWRRVIDRGELRPVLTMPHAHKDLGTRCTPNGRKVARSITSLVYAVGKPYSVISSGAFDGCVGFV